MVEQGKSNRILANPDTCHIWQVMPSLSASQRRLFCACDRQKFHNAPLARQGYAGQQEFSLYNQLNGALFLECCNDIIKILPCRPVFFEDSDYFLRRIFSDYVDYCFLHRSGALFGLIRRYSAQRVFVVTQYIRILDHWANRRVGDACLPNLASLHPCHHFIPGLPSSWLFFTASVASPRYLKPDRELKSGNRPSLLNAVKTSRMWSQVRAMSCCWALVINNN